MGRHLIFVTTHPIQYIVPLYQKLNIDGTISFEVIYCTDETIKGSIDKHFGREIKWDIPLLENYKYRFIKNHSWKPSINNGLFGILNFGIISILWRAPKKSLVVITGWSNATYILAIIFGSLFGHKVALRIEAPEFKEKNRRGFIAFARKSILNLTFKLWVNYGFYIGTQNKNFYKFYGFKDKALFFTPYCVDNERFGYDFNRLILKKSQLRYKYNVPLNAFVILFTGKFYDVKRPFDLLKAYARAEVSQKYLVMVGDGVLKSEIEEFVIKEGISSVLLPGFINQTEISEYYAISDVLVLCSESETWGLSVNEAMNFQLPIILNDSIGCHSDLLKPNKNGFLVKKGDLFELAQAISKLGNDINFRSLAGLESKKIIENYSFDKIIEGFKTALNK